MEYNPNNAGANNNKNNLEMAPDHISDTGMNDFINNAFIDFEDIKAAKLAIQQIIGFNQALKHKNKRNSMTVNNNNNSTVNSTSSDGNINQNKNENQKTADTGLGEKDKDKDSKPANIVNTTDDKSTVNPNDSAATNNNNNNSASGNNNEPHIELPEYFINIRCSPKSAYLEMWKNANKQIKDSKVENSNWRDNNVNSTSAPSNYAKNKNANNNTNNPHNNNNNDFQVSLSPKSIINRENLINLNIDQFQEQFFSPDKSAKNKHKQKGIHEQNNNSNNNNPNYSNNYNNSYINIGNSSTASDNNSNNPVVPIHFSSTRPKFSIAKRTCTAVTDSNSGGGGNTTGLTGNNNGSNNGNTAGGGEGGNTNVNSKLGCYAKGPPEASAKGFAPSYSVNRLKLLNEKKN